MHKSIEGRLWRWWFREPWTLEIAWSRAWFQLGAEFAAFTMDSPPHITLSVPFLSVYLTVPMQRDRPEAWNGWAYGFKVSPEYLTVHTGDDTGRRSEGLWMFEWPWRRWHHVRHETFGEPRTYPYRYHPNSGEVQEREATIQVEEREWRWLWKNSPWRRMSRYIHVEFSDEVGEETGSWNGGTIGCSYELKRRETPVMCLRRMERERTF